MLGKSLLSPTRLELEVEAAARDYDMGWQAVLSALDRRLSYSRRDICAAMRFLGIAALPAMKRLPLWCLGDTELRRPIVRAINLHRAGLGICEIAEKLDMEPELVREIGRRYTKQRRSKEMDQDHEAMIAMANVRDIKSAIRSSAEPVAVLLSAERSRVLAVPAAVLDLPGGESLGLLVGVYTAESAGLVVADIDATLKYEGLPPDATWADLAAATGTQVARTISDERRELAYQIWYTIGAPYKAIARMVGMGETSVRESIRERRQCG